MSLFGFKIHNYRATILEDRLVPHVEEKVGNYQRGFRNDRNEDDRSGSTTDQIVTMRQNLEKMAEYRDDSYHLFIEFKAAYDSIDSKMTITNVSCQIKVDGKLSGLFATTGGLRPGLVCLLFHLALERAIRDSRVES